MTTPPSPVVLRAADVSVVLDIAGPRHPRVLHWGRDLGDLSSDEAASLRPGLPLLPLASDGWPGRPAVAGYRDETTPHLRLVLSEPVSVHEGGITVRSTDADVAVAVTSELELDEHGVVRLRHTVINTGPDRWRLAGALCVLPVPDTAQELLDFTGRWCRERSPQRAPLRYATSLAETHRGRSGFDSAGTVLAGTDGFGFRHGEVWLAHLAWSGNAVRLAEHLVDAGTAFGVGELLEPGEVVLAAGESYQTPWTYFVHSAAGMDGVSARLHAALRARPHHPATARPMTFNSWEAVYFDLDLDRLRTLADRAASIGVERFVLDDGWFGGRRHDAAGLGDWVVAPDMWPDGLHPLADHVLGLGMQFGLWVEPEMVNPDSDLFRAHPDWVLAAPGRLPPEHRHQHVLDLANPAAYAYLRERLDALLTEYRIGYLKWDHNRELVEPVHDGRSGVHAQTLALYRLLDELRARHPGVEIESCSSGGGRVDLGILERTDRVWASDCTDPVERQAIQRWTSLLLPPELIGSHVSSPVAHTTMRETALSYRAITALFGHAGIEWDITTCSADELAQLKRWIDAYRRLRPLLHGGTLVRVDPLDVSRWTHGVVAPDGQAAVFAHVALGSSPDEGTHRIRLPGLHPGTRYLVRPAPEIELPATWRSQLPSWVVSGTPTTGRLLEIAGLPAPQLLPQQALLLDVIAEPRGATIG